MTGRQHDCHLKLFDYSHTAAPDYYLEHRHTVIVLHLLESAPPLPNLAITPGHYLERYLVEFEELAVSGRAAPGANYRVFTETPEPVRTLLENGLADFLRQHPGFYLEIRDNALLAFHPARELEEPEDVLRWMFDLAGLLARADALA